MIMTVQVNNRKYKVSFSSFLKILGLKFRLLFRRVKRWKKLLKVSDAVLIGMLFAIWGIGCWIFAIIDKRDFVNTLSSIKADIYASVIIVAFINLFGRVHEYSSFNKNQFHIYLDILSAFDTLYIEYYGRMSGHYMPLYCDKTIETTRELVASMKVPYSEKKLKALSFIAAKELDTLKYYNNNGRLNGCSQSLLQFEIASCEQKLYGISNDDKNFIQTYMEDLIIDASILIDDIRTIWFQDLDLEQRIWQILLKEGYSLLDDFYIRMFLYTVDIIEKYVITTGAFDDMTEERCLESLALIGIEPTSDFNFKLFKKQVEDKNQKRKGRLF